MLPVVVEMQQLQRVLEDVFHYEVQVFEIPEHRSHSKVVRRIADFIELNDDSQEDLKIVYYGGHGETNISKDLLFHRFVLVSHFYVRK